MTVADQLAIVRARATTARLNAMVLDAKAASAQVAAISASTREALAARQSYTERRVGRVA